MALGHAELVNMHVHARVTERGSGVAGVLRDARQAIFIASSEMRVPRISELS